MKTYKTEQGQEYFYIYKVMAIEIKTSKKYNLSTYLNEQDANEYRDFAKHTYNKMYKYFWIEKDIVWTKVL